MSNTWVNRAAVPVVSVEGTDAAGMTERFGSSVDFNTYADNAEWLYDPDLSAVTGQPTKFWIITGDVVTLMDQAAQDAITAQELSDARDAKANRLNDLENDLRQVVKLTIGELNDHSLTINAILDAIDNASNFGQVKSAIAAISDLPVISFSQAKTKIRTGWGT